MCVCVCVCVCECAIAQKGSAIFPPFSESVSFNTEYILLVDTVHAEHFVAMDSYQQMLFPLQFVYQAINLMVFTH